MVPAVVQQSSDGSRHWESSARRWSRNPEQAVAHNWAHGPEQTAHRSGWRVEPDGKVVPDGMEHRIRVLHSWSDQSSDAVEELHTSDAAYAHRKFPAVAHG